MSQLGNGSPLTPTFRKDYHDEFDNDHQQQFQRRSVLAKVKEKARRWRQRLVRKKQVNGTQEESTPAWGVTLEEDDEEDWEEQAYHRAPMYQSEPAPAPKPSLETSKLNEPSENHATSPPPSPEETIEPPKQWPLNPFDDEEDMQMITAPPETPVPAPMERSGSIKRIADAVTSVLFTPAYNMVSGATQILTSKIQSPPDETGAKEVYDKGISVKEYLRDKLEPGDGEKALSEVITEAISPKKAAAVDRDRVSSDVIEDVGVVEKVRGVVSSLIWRREAPAPAIMVSPAKS